MSYEFLEAARIALARGDYVMARDIMFGPFERGMIDRATPGGLREWADKEQDGGYGLRAEILRYFAGRFVP
jgi:hypothetical protein